MLCQKLRDGLIREVNLDVLADDLYVQSGLISVAKLHVEATRRGDPGVLAEPEVSTCLDVFEFILPNIVFT